MRETEIELAIKPMALDVALESTMRKETLKKEQERKEQKQEDKESSADNVKARMERVNNDATTKEVLMKKTYL